MNTTNRLLFPLFFLLLSPFASASHISMWCWYGAEPQMYQVLVDFEVTEDQIKAKLPLQLHGGIISFSQMRDNKWQPLKEQFDPSLLGTVSVQQQRLVLRSAEGVDFQIYFKGLIDPRYHSGAGEIKTRDLIVNDAQCSSFLTMGPRPGLTVSN